MKDKISIIVPVYNVEKYIGETISSVRSQMYENWELILVTDGCTDQSAAIIEKIQNETGDERIRLIRQPQNMGAARARNRGVEEATGRFIAYLDSDDLWKPDKLLKEIEFMKRVGAGFAFTGYEFADEAGCGTGRVVRVPPALNYRQALRNTTIFTSTVMFDTEKIAKAELVMPQMKSEDTALWWSVLRSGRTAYGLDENLVLYRRSANTLSSNKLEAVRRIWMLYRRAEHLSVLGSMYYFCHWAVRAVGRRM